MPGRVSTDMYMRFQTAFLCGTFFIHAASSEPEGASAFEHLRVHSAGSEARTWWCWNGQFRWRLGLRIGALAVLGGAFRKIEIGYLFCQLEWKTGTWEKWTLASRQSNWG